MCVYDHYTLKYNLPICRWSACINGDSVSLVCHVCFGHGVKLFKCCCCAGFGVVFVQYPRFECAVRHSADGTPAYGLMEYDVDEGVAMPPNGCAK